MLRRYTNRNQFLKLSVKPSKRALRRRSAMKKIQALLQVSLLQVQPPSPVPPVLQLLHTPQTIRRKTSQLQPLSQNLQLPLRALSYQKRKTSQKRRLLRLPRNHQHQLQRRRNQRKFQLRQHNQQKKLLNLVNSYVHFICCVE